jgi:O-antigen/teichoic acid export membrane protein
MLYVLVSRWTYYITVPLFLAYMVYPRMILGGLFGAAYSARGLPVLRALALGAMFNVSTGSVGVLTLSLRQSRRYLMYDVIALTATATLSILLVPRIGMMGAAVANVAGNVLWNVTALEFVRRSLGIYPFTWSHLRFSAIIACGLAAIVSATSFVPWVVGDARALTAIAVYLPFSVLVVKRFVQQEARGLRLSTVRAA